MVFWYLRYASILWYIGLPVLKYAKQKHLECKKGEANQKQWLSDYTCD